MGYNMYMSKDNLENILLSKLNLKEIKESYKKRNVKIPPIVKI